MPLSKYDRYFGGNAQKAYNSMVAQHGEKKGKQVFYATLNKRRLRKKKS